MEVLASGSSMSVPLRTKSQTLTSTASTSKPAAAQAGPQHTAAAVVQPSNSMSRSKSTPIPRRQNSQKLEAASFTATLPVQTGPKSAEQFSTFESMIEGSDIPVLVDFYAPWCGPCQLMSRVVSALSNELIGDLKVVKINIDKYPKLASKYRISALPTCLLFRDGKLVDRVDGFMPEQTFGKRVRFYVSGLDKKFGRR